MSTLIKNGKPALRRVEHKSFEKLQDFRSFSNSSIHIDGFNLKPLQLHNHSSSMKKFYFVVTGNQVLKPNVKILNFIYTSLTSTTYRNRRQSHYSIAQMHQHV